MSISSPTHHCPQIDDIGSKASSDTTSMEKTNQDLHRQQQQQQQLPPLKCPRCDSLNTKFCYYNNYSLSQPRHFCKACKRYWTRGGTLRNIPIGGGCRKNKRVKRLNTSSPSSVPAPTPVISSSNNHTTLNRANPLLYNQSDVSVRLPRLTSSNLYDVGSQINAFEFGFSSLGGCGFTSQGYGGDNGKDYKIQIHPTTQMSDVVSSNSLLPNFPFFLGSSSSTANSLVPSTLQQQTRPTHNFPSLGDQMTIMKEVKVEEGNKETNQNPIEPIGLFDSSTYWNMMNAGAWADLSNYGSSVTSLI